MGKQENRPFVYYTERKELLSFLKNWVFLLLLELNDREEDGNHFPIIYGVGKSCARLRGGGRLRPQGRLPVKAPATSEPAVSMSQPQVPILAALCLLGDPGQGA